MAEFCLRRLHKVNIQALVIAAGQKYQATSNASSHPQTAMPSARCVLALPRPETLFLSQPFPTEFHGYFVMPSIF
jgi:hypothetical protein